MLPATLRSYITTLFRLLADTISATSAVSRLSVSEQGSALCYKPCSQLLYLHFPASFILPSSHIHKTSYIAMTKDDYEQASLMSNMQNHQSLHKIASHDRDSDIESGSSSLTQLNDEDDDEWMTKGRARSKDFRFTLTIPQTSFRTHLAYGATIFGLFFIAVTLLRMAYWRGPPLPPSRAIAATNMVKPHNYRIQASVFCA